MTGPDSAWALWLGMVVPSGANGAEELVTGGGEQLWKAVIVSRAGTQQWAWRIGASGQTQARQVGDLGPQSAADHRGGLCLVRSVRLCEMGMLV